MSLIYFWDTKLLAGHPYLVAQVMVGVKEITLNYILELFTLPINKGMWERISRPPHIQLNKLNKVTLDLEILLQSLPNNAFLKFIIFPLP